MLWYGEIYCAMLILDFACVRLLEILVNFGNFGVSYLCRVVYWFRVCPCRGTFWFCWVFGVGVGGGGDDDVR